MADWLSHKLKVTLVIQTPTALCSTGITETNLLAKEAKQLDENKQIAVHD